MVAEIFEKAGLYVLAGVKGVGKSSLMISLIDEISRLKEEKVSLYCYSATNAVRLPAKSERIKIVELSELPVQTGHLYLESEWAKADHGLSAVIVDGYRFLLRTESFHDIDLTKNEKILFLLTRFKTLAEVYDVPVIITCGVDDDFIYGRRDNRPLLDDVQEYQYIKAFADRIMLLHREEMFDPETEKKGIAELRVIDPSSDSYHDLRLAYIQDAGRFCDLQME